MKYNKQTKEKAKKKQKACSWQEFISYYTKYYTKYTSYVVLTRTWIKKIEYSVIV